MSQVNPNIPLCPFCDCMESNCICDEEENLYQYKRKLNTNVPIFELEDMNEIQIAEHFWKQECDSHYTFIEFPQQINQSTVV